MQIDVGACLAELLYEHPSVTIPGLGAFVGAYKPAHIDQVEGKIAPPSKQISFNKNLLVDDGLLVKCLREKFHLSYGEAMRAVDDFAKQVKESIERREIVTFENVGRLYKNYQQDYQFLPEGTNFNADAYGLPALEYKPVVRTAPEKVAALAKKSSVPVPGVQRSWIQNNLLALSTGAALLVAGGVYFLLFFPAAKPQAEATRPTLSTSRVNVSPTQEDESVEETTTTLKNGEDDGDESDTESATPKPGQKSAIIAIGVFSNPENVERLVKKIYEEGYEPYTQKSGKLTRVGVQMKYDKTADINKALQVIRKKFGAKATVLKK